MAPCPTLILIGPRAAGKTAIGRAVGALLRRRFVDLDDLARARFGGAAISDIWSRHGESAFRAAEAEALVDVLDRGRFGDDASPDIVLALGGGTPMIESARRRLAAARASGQARIVLLLADASVLAARVDRDGGVRPSLTGASPAAEVATVLASRLPTYRTLADVTFDTGAHSVDETASAITRWAQAIP